MAKDVALLGAVYLNVPAVVLPKNGGGQAVFTEVSDTTATASDVLSGKYFYTAAGVKTQGTMTSGSATTPATTITANPSISVSNSGLITATASATQSVTPTVVEGYVSSGTAGTITVSGSNTSQLTTQAATTYTPTTANQTIASGKYLTGAQTILGDANLTAENIKKDVSIFGVTGTYEGSGGGGGTPVNFSISGDAAGTQFLYVDDSGTYHKISGASVSGTSIENNLVVVFQNGPDSPVGYTITGLTHKETISLGSRANYKSARIYVVTA